MTNQKKEATFQQTIFIIFNFIFGVHQEKIFLIRFKIPNYRCKYNIAICRDGEAKDNYGYGDPLPSHGFAGLLYIYKEVKYLT